jgi:DNA polymerase III epsilon subunit-like protein
MDLADRVPECEIKTLDEVLEHCGFARREEDVPHDAIEDAQLVAKIYMVLIKKP